MADEERLLGVRADSPEPIAWPEEAPLPAPSSLSPPLRDGARPLPPPDPWPPAAQWVTAFAVAVLLALLAWRGWGMSRWSARPLPIERNAFPSPIELNTAGQHDLERIPGLGPAQARSILDHRQAHGPFRSVEDLLAVSGIGPATLARVRSYLWVAPAPEQLPPRVVRGVAPAQSKKKPPEEPIDLNSAPVEELQKLPGIGPTLSARIVQMRQQRPFTSVEELRRVKGIGAKTLEKLRPHVRVGADQK